MNLRFDSLSVFRSQRDYFRDWLQHKTVVNLRQIDWRKVTNFVSIRCLLPTMSKSRAVKGHPMSEQINVLSVMKVTKSGNVHCFCLSQLNSVPGYMVRDCSYKFKCRRSGRGKSYNSSLQIGSSTSGVRSSKIQIGFASDKIGCPQKDLQVLG